MRLHSPLFATNPRRTVIETSLLSACLLVAASSLVAQNSNTFLTIDIIGVIFYTFRLRMSHPIHRRTAFNDVLSMLVCSLLICVCETPVALWIFYPGGNSWMIFSSDTLLLLCLLIPIGNLVVFGCFRLAIRLWSAWNRVRRRHLLWSLTHSHMMLIVFVTGALMLLVDAVVLFTNAQAASNLWLLIPVTLLLMIPSLVALLIIVPPFTLFSYFVVRRTTDRLRSLMTATSTLRTGNYSVRVEVTGEDEVAQLQRDFNDMARDLERTVHALQEERDRVSLLLQERRELIANVSHELRTPVATMRGYLETTLIHWEQVTPTALQQDMQIMENEVIHLQGRVDDLFMLSRADVGALQMQCEPTNVAALIEEIVNTRAPLAWRASRVEVVANIAHALPCALVDARRLQQAIQNLLHNGLRHTSPGGIVAIEASFGRDAIKVQVKDTGEGIAPEDLEHIWERYYQVARSRSHGVGAGLGLALVKEWVEEMNGHVAVESTLGQGSCFTLWLPIARD